MLAHRRTCAVALGTLIAAAAVTTSAQDLVLGPELPMDPQVDLPDGGPSVEQLFVIDTGYLVVGGGEAIRLRPDGTSLDPVPFSFGHPTSEVTCGPTQCLIATSSPVTTQRVQPDGTLVDATPVAVASGTDVRVAWAGDRYFVAWSDTVSGDSDLYFVHLRPDGTQVEAAPVHVALPDSQYPLSVSCDASACLLVHQEVGASYQARAMRIGHDGTVLDPLGIPVPSGNETALRVVSQGSFHFVYWPYLNLVEGVRIGTDGTILDPAPLDLGVHSSHPLHQAGCSASGCLLPIRYSDNLRIHRIDGTGPPVRGVSFAWDTDTSAIACSASDCRMAYSEYASTNVMSTVALTPTGEATLGTPIQPVLRANAQLAPHVVAGDSDFLVSWVDERATPNEVRVVRLNSGGALMAESSVVTSDDRRASGGTIGAYGGGTYFVGWHENQQLFVRRVLADGTLPDLNPIRVNPTFRNTTSSQVAFDSTNFMFTWMQDSTLVGLRMSPVGATLETEPFVVHSSHVMVPALAFGETSHMTIWSESRGTRGLEIYGRGIATDGTPEQALSFPVASADRSQTNPAIAYGGGHYLAVWVDDRYFDTIGHNLIYAARVLQDGTVLDPAGIQVRAGDVGRVEMPTVAWNGTEFVVAWEEVAEIEDPPGVLREEVRYVALARVAVDGTVLDPVPVKTSALERNVAAGRLSLASTPAGTTMLVYSRFDDSPTVRANRVFARTVMSGSMGTSCGSPDDCASGVCVDGVCCDRACDGACEACTVAGGAPVNGVCAPKAAGTVCRASSGAVCDVDEVCDGASAACPTDAPDPSCDSPDGGAGVDAGGMGRQDGGAIGGDAGVMGGDGGSDVPPGGDGGCSASGGHRASGAPWYGLGLLLGLVVCRRTRRRQLR